eukprot:880345-Alexandrium_andersonii.AAC.1
MLGVAVLFEVEGLLLEEDLQHCPGGALQGPAVAPVRLVLGACCHGELLQQLAVLIHPGIVLQRAHT